MLGMEMYLERIELKNRDLILTWYAPLTDPFSSTALEI